MVEVGIIGLDLAKNRKAWLFAGSQRGGDRAAFFFTLIVSAKLNDVDPDVDPQAWLADVLARIADTPMSRLDSLIPWNWAADQKPVDVKAA